jgi:LPXTG-motif cell wall-anchored protein
VRNPIRRFVGVALMGLLGALFAMPMLTAGAQQAQAVASDCTFSVTPNPSAPDYIVSGTAPDATIVTLYFAPDGGGAVAVPPSQPGPNFSFNFTAPSSGTISVGYVTTVGNGYTAVCAIRSGDPDVHVAVQVAGENVGVGGENVSVGGESASVAPLAFTGSSNTPSYVLIGIAAVVLGAVLVVAARRRSRVS